MSAKETFSLEPTRKVTKENLECVLYEPFAFRSILPPHPGIRSILIPIQIWDCPANHPIENLPILLGAFSTVIYVIDIQALFFIV